ncbi:MAG TPA: SDR family NAD(P)-dependent oxidoreductase, partial [Candidatus Brocadiia bacterium]|nr:SDR family NAD(P)-dependent oxidoreductase [Candidatus Brocadiia bacterium]
MNLNGKAVLVAGGSGAIGAAVVQACAAAGARVAFTWFSREDAAQTLRRQLPDALAVQADGRSPQSCQDAVRAAADRFGRLDGFVHCIGVTGDSLFVRQKEEAWEDLLRVNLLSAVSFCRAAARPMLVQRSGSIVAVTSIAASVPSTGQAAYAATKGAMESLVRALAVEFGPKGIRANAIAPGRIESPMTAALHQREAGRLLDR